MRVSVIATRETGNCKNCGNWAFTASYTVTVGTSTETSPPLCVACEGGEAVVDLPPPPPVLTGPPGRRVKAASARNERRVAEGIGGRTQPGSGNQPGAKGDVRKRGAYRVENKDSYSNQFILRLAVLNKIRGECGTGEKPALVLTFMEKNTMRPRERWAIIPYPDWESHASGEDR